MNGIDTQEMTATERADLQRLQEMTPDERADFRRRLDEMDELLGLTSGS